MTATTQAPITTVAQLSQHVDQEVTLQGWLYNKRSSGKIQFLILRVGSGQVQCVGVKKELDEALAELKTSLGGANFESIKSNTEKVSTISQALGALMYASASAQAEGAPSGDDGVEDAEVIDAEESK